VARPSALQLEPQVCLPACRAALQSAGRDVRPAVRVQVVAPVSAQHPVSLAVCPAQVRLPAAWPKDARRAALLEAPELATVWRLVSCPELALQLEASLHVHSVQSQVRAVA
jgi:hypothetical protein